MRVKLFAKREFEFRWPTVDPTEEDQQNGCVLIPEEEKIVILLKKMNHHQKRTIEDSMVSATQSTFQRGRKTQGSSDVNMSYKIGHVKDMRLNSSVTGWKNVLDEDGNELKYTFEKLCDLMSSNAGLDPEVYGHFENDLLADIDLRNSMADTTEVNPKN